MELKQIKASQNISSSIDLAGLMENLEMLQEQIDTLAIRISVIEVTNAGN